MKRILFLLSFVSVLMLTGCKTRESIVYLQDVPTADSTYTVNMGQKVRIRPGDKISIIVNSSIPEMASTFNLSVPYRFVGGQNTSNGQSQTAYYVVDDNGEIDIPVLGKLKVGEMTRHEIAEYVKSCLLQKELLKDAVVSVEYGNLAFSVLGEVQAPGRYTFDKDRVTILDAISMAKDLTINGRRDNVLVTRTDERGNQQTYRVDLRKAKKLYASPVYCVQQNDIIYVEPNINRVRQSTLAGNTVQNPSFWISVASLLTTITALIIR